MMLNSVINQFRDDTYFREGGALGDTSEDLYDQYRHLQDSIFFLELANRWRRQDYAAQALLSIALRKDLNKANGVDKDA